MIKIYVKCYLISKLVKIPSLKGDLIMPSGNIMFGRRMKELRIANHLTQEQLAEKVGLEYQTISRIETGYYFTNYDNLEKFSKAFGVPISELFNYDHMTNKTHLKEKINKEIENMNLAELQYIYKSIMNLKEYK